MKSCYIRAKLKVRSLCKEQPSSSALHVRHAKCLKPQEPQQVPGNKLRKQQGKGTTEPTTCNNSSKTKSTPFAQIRSIPLCLSQLRSPDGMRGESSGAFLQRSSYVVNTQHEEIHVKRARSLSPVILRTTAVEPLTSPRLVRSSSFPKKTGRKRFSGSFIPVRSTFTSASRESRTRSLTPTPIPDTIPQPTISASKNQPSLLSPRLSGKGPSTLCGIVRITGKTCTCPITTTSPNKSPGVTNHQLSQQRGDDELGGIIPSSSGRKTHVRSSFGSQLLGGPAQGGGGRQSNTSANGLPRGRRMKMDIHSAPPPTHQGGGTARMISTKSAPLVVQQPVYSHMIHRKLSPDYPMYYKSPSISSSIYSEPIHQSRSSHKQGVFSQRSVFGRQQPPSSAMFDDDPGIMSEAETSSTGFRRGLKARSSLPVVRTPSKTLERPLGLVFLQYRTETKRALLPNEITSLDTVKALFVRSFPRQLSMEYLDAMNVKIYIHDSSKDSEGREIINLFYELEDLRDIRDRSVLRLFEPNINGNGAVPSWDQDQSYFSEPEFDSEYQHQHIHKTKGSKTPPYLTYSYPIGATNSLPRVNRPFSPAPIKSNGSSAPPKPQRQYPSLTKRPIAVPADSALYSPRTTGGQDGRSAFPMPPSGYITPDLRRNIYSSTEPTYVSSPERRYIEDPYYAQFPPPRSGSITPVIIDEESRFRMEHMERQLANLTGLVQKALVHPPVPTPTRLVHSSPLPRTILPVGAITPPTQNAYRDYIPTRDYRDDIDKHSSSSSASLPDDPVRPIAENHIPSNAGSHKAPKFGKEKSVSFSDDPPDHGKQHSPSQYSAEKPTKPAIKIKSTTLPRMSQDRVLKPVPAAATGVPKPNLLPAQPATLINIPSHVPSHPYERQYYSGPRGELGLNPEMFNQLRNLQKKARELKGDIRVLRRSVQAQAHSVRETIKDTFLRFKVVAMAGNDQWMQGDPEKARIHREKEYYKQEMLKLDNDLEELEVTVEELRSHVITKRTIVLMSDVENMAMVLSKASKSVADLKTRFPSLQESVKVLLTNEMDYMMVEEKFLKEEPERLEIALRRCKKLTGTLVTLKRLASVQEQRLPSKDGEPGSPVAVGGSTSPQPQNAKVNNRGPGGTISSYGFGEYTTGSIMGAATGVNYATGTAVGPENALDDLLNELDGVHHNATYKQNRLEPPRRLPSYPSTDSPTARSPQKTHPPLAPKPSKAKIPPPPPPRTSSRSPLISPSIESDSSESINSQDGGNSNRLSQRHQELLRKQKLLQEQYNRLQVLQQRSGSTGSESTDKLELKKTGSESNLRAKLGLEFSAAPTGSLSNINKQVLYETDIL